MDMTTVSSPCSHSRHSNFCRDPLLPGAVGAQWCWQESSWLQENSSSCPQNPIRGERAGEYLAEQSNNLRVNEDLS